MCGWGAVVSLHGTPITSLHDRLETIGTALRHRGPDATSFWKEEDSSFGFVHTHLAIRDARHVGDQPHISESGTVLAFNGEVYNSEDLRICVGLAAGSSTSDTPVVHRVLDQFGENAWSKLIGMYSLGFWRPGRKRFLAARDEFGVKPLYYALEGDLLYVASEIAALLPFLNSLETDDIALEDYFQFQFQLSGRTLFRGISEIPPGSTLKADVNGVKVERIDNFGNASLGRGVDEFHPMFLEELLTNVVSEHLQSDTPIAAFLSGGLDSSAITALAARVSPRPIPSFVGRYLEGPLFDESSYAQIVASSVSSPLKVVDISAQHFEAHLVQTVRALGVPGAGPGAVGQFIVAGEVARNYRVVLSGSGADELYGGYPRYLRGLLAFFSSAGMSETSGDGALMADVRSALEAMEKGFHFRPPDIRDPKLEPEEIIFRLSGRAQNLSGLVEPLLLDGESSYSRFSSITSSISGGKISSLEDFFRVFRLFDLGYQLPAILRAEDAVTMAYGLEARVPFLDRRLTGVALEFTATELLKGGFTKAPLRELAKGFLPSAVWQRREKMGFPVPLARWIEEDRAPLVKEIIRNSFSRGRSYLVDSTPRAWEKVFHSKDTRSIWSLLCLEIWQDAFHDKADEIKWRG